MNPALKYLIRKFPTGRQLFLGLAILLILDILGGFGVSKLADRRDNAALEGASCKLSEQDLKKMDVKNMSSCVSDNNCVVIAGACEPEAINRDYVCLKKVRPQNPDNLTFRVMSQNVICVTGPWQPLPHVVPAIKHLLLQPVCVHNKCKVQ